jgi:ADP-heptose:LPS heptosyltransferase
MKSSSKFNHRLGNLPLQTVVIVRSLPGLGDLLCIIPALRALRTAYPNAKLVLIGLPQTASWLQRFPSYVDQWLAFPGHLGIPEVAFVADRTLAFLSQIQARSIDLALQLHGNGSAINSFTLLLGAAQTAGFFPAGQRCPDVDRFLPYPEHEPEIWRHLKLLEFLGIPPQGEQLEFPLWASDWQELAAIGAAHPQLETDYVCLHPGASTADRRWSLRSFAQVGDALAAQGRQIVLTGTMAEQALTHAVAEHMRFPVIDLAGKTSLGGLAALLHRSQLLICNDTGVSHLAAALQVRSVVIFTNSDPQRWAPLDRQRHQVVQCSHSGDHPADIEQVLTAASREVTYAL